MLIYLALLVPAITLLILLGYFRSTLHPAEVLLLITVPALLIFIAKWTTESIQTHDTEYWGSYATKAVYDEEWNEYIHKTCSSTTCTGSGKSRTCSTSYYDCSYVEDHPPQWYLIDTANNSFSMSPAEFDQFIKRWGNRSFQDLNHHYYTRNGNRYYTTWDNRPETLEGCVTTHSYENRIQASNSIFKFLPVTNEDAKREGLFDYPAVNGWKQRVVLGINSDGGEHSIQDINSTLGTSKQIKVFVLVFHNKPMQIASDQQNYWKGANKNEFVVALSVDDAGKTQWVWPFCWGNNEQLKVDTKDALMNQASLDLVQFATWLKPQIQINWHRQHFKEFSYISVDPPTWVCVIIWITTILGCIFYSYWCVTNDYNFETFERSLNK